MIPLWFIALHMLGDFVLQNNWMAKNKFTNSIALLLHVSVYSIPFFILGYLTLPIPLAFVMTSIIFILHTITDSDRWITNKEWPPGEILADQTLHALQLALIAQMFYA